MNNGREHYQSDLWRIVAVLILIVVCGYIAYQIRQALYPLLFGFFLAYAAVPFVAKLESKNMSRSAATALVFLGGLIFSLVLLVFVADQISRLVMDLFAVDESGNKLGAAYKALEWLETRFAELNEKFEIGERGREFIQELPERIAASWQEVATTAGGIFGVALNVFGSLFGLLSMAVLTPIFAFLILLDFERIQRGIPMVFQENKREKASSALKRIGQILGAFLRGRLITGFLKGAGQAVLLIAIGAPYPILTGVLSWFLSFVPFVGPVLAFVPTILILAIGGEWITIILAVVVLGLGELIEGYILIPKIVGRDVGLSALEVLLALLIGGAAFGFLGLFLCVPVAAILKALFLEKTEDSSSGSPPPSG